MRSRFWEWLAVVAGFTALALWQTSSLFGRWTTHYLGGGELEGWLWRYWWMKKMMAAAWESGLGYAAYVSAVAGSFPETGNVFDLQLLSWPLEALLGDPLYYNVKCVLVLALNGVGGYALGRSLFRDPAAATACGLVLALSPYALYEIDNGRVRQALMFPLALYALHLVRLWRKPSLREAALAGLWAGLSSAVYLYYGMAAVLFTLIFVGCASALRLDGRLTLRRLQLGLLVLMTALCVTLPFTWAYLDRRLRGEEIPEVQWLRDFPTLQELTSPNPETVLKQNDPLLNSVQRFRNDSMPWQYAFMPGWHRNLPWVFSLLGLLALPLALAFRSPGWRGLVPWLLGAAFFYLLTLGPYFKTGPTDAYVGDGVASPYVLLFKYLPFFSRLFSPVRMTAMMLVCLGVLVGACLHVVFTRFRAGAWVRAASVALVLVLVAHGMRMSNQASMRTTRVLVPDYYRKLAAEPFCTIVELPFRTGDFLQNYQTVHEKKLLLGWSDGAVPPGFPPESEIAALTRVIERLPENTFLQFLEDLNVRPAEARAFTPADLEFMRKEGGVRYVIVHERGCYLVAKDGAAHYRAILDALTRHFGPPVEVSSEYAFERFGERDPKDPPPYEYGLAVFRL